MSFASASSSWSAASACRGRDRPGGLARQALRQRGGGASCERDPRPPRQGGPPGVNASEPDRSPPGAAREGRTRPRARLETTTIPSAWSRLPPEACRLGQGGAGRGRTRAQGSRCIVLEALRDLVEAFLDELPFAAELGKLEEALRYSLLGAGSASAQCCAWRQARRSGGNRSSFSPPGARSSSCTPSALSTMTCPPSTTTHRRGSRAADPRVRRGRRHPRRRCAAR